MITTLAIETSCDDTSLSIVSFDGNFFAVDKLLAYSQIDDHQKYWGVVPEFASRLHSEKIIAVLQNIWREEIQKTDFISVTTHPWLPGSLVVGKAVASFLSKQFHKPLVEVNHIYGHLFSLFLERNVKDIKLPMVVLTASGGHNDVYLVEDEKMERLKNGNMEKDFEWKDFGWYKIARLGKTLDDAAGECFDKVARMLGGPYPGGARIAEKASRSKGEEKRKGGMEELLAFKRIFLSKDWYDFSFSWMKSQVSFLLKQLEKNWELPLQDKKIENWKLEIPEDLVCDIAYEFQEAVVEVLVKKLIRAAIAFDAPTIGLAGWVSCNDRLREYLNEYWKTKIKNGEFLRPMKKVYSTDNGAMIWLAWILEFKNTEI